MLFFAIIPWATLLYSSTYITVPNGFYNVEGNSFSDLTFGKLTPVRYQQIFAASQFSQLPPGGSFISVITFRADCSSADTVGIPNLQINLSTSLKAPDQLSMVFADNIGPDETMVFGPEPFSTPPYCGTNCPCTFIHSRYLALESPFLYNPANGNLLMELRISAMNYGGRKLDAQDTTNDSVSCIASFSLQDTTATVMRTAGVITYFRFDSLPSLESKIETNTFILKIPLYPGGFHLQDANFLSNNILWNNYPLQTEKIGIYNYARIPLNRGVSAQYFRLFWQNPGVPPISLAAPSALAPPTPPATNSLTIPLNPKYYEQP